jgi:hypothetical protein
MKAHICEGLLVLALALSANAQVFPSVLVVPNYYPFVQSGYENGTAYGWFWGTDQNNDGYLTTSELSTFQFSFQGNRGDSFASLAVPVNEMFANGGGFSFKLGGTLLGDDTGEFIAAGIGGALTSGFSYVSGPDGGVFSSTFPGWPFSRDTTPKIVDVLPVVLIPEPATYALMLAGVVVIRIIVRRGAQRR